MFRIEGEYNTADVKLDKKLVEKECFEQIKEMADNKAFEGDNNIAIMPDTHWGSGAVIGFTMPLGKKVCPNTIGVDIGCGMYARNYGEIETDITNDQKLAQIDERIRNRVPMGFKVFDRTDYHMKKDFPWHKCQEKLEKFNENSDIPDVKAEYDISYFKNLVDRLGYKTGRAINSIGTLGGGNHFIELGRSEKTGDVWCIIHSGSRGVGAKIAEYWQKEAEERRKHEWCYRQAYQTKMPNGKSIFPYVKFDKFTDQINLVDWLQGGKGESFMRKDKIREDFEGEEIEEAFSKLRNIMPDKREANNDLDYLDEYEMQEYIRDMIFAQTYASESRKEMMNQVSIALNACGKDSIESVHNYIDFEDQTIRKGSCRAHKNERIIIPFNMSYGTLIAKGKGNKEWNKSAPHGAGRAMSRTDAKETYNSEDMEEQTKGVYMSEKPVDETPKAYKKPEHIEETIGETAEVIDRIKPFLSIKAD